MKAKELFQAGKLNEAIQSLGADLRNNPTDTQRRIFLFELLCFAGEYDRAEKHLDIVGQGDKNTEIGALLYRGAIHAERTRQECFSKKQFPAPPVETRPLSGTLNGTPFESIEDADPRIGPRLEVYAAGSYLWVPFEHIASLQMTPPQRLRDLLWAPAMVMTGPGFQDKDLGEVLLPAIAALSAKHPDEHVRLGRTTLWPGENDPEEAVFGQKMLLVDGEDFPLLEVRELIIQQPDSEAPDPDASS
jgi:type VI secretion system protein ImpE